MTQYTDGPLILKYAERTSCPGYIYVYTHINIHTYIHTHVYTCTHNPDGSANPKCVPRASCQGYIHNIHAYMCTHKHTYIHTHTTQMAVQIQSVFRGHRARASVRNYQTYAHHKRATTLSAVYRYPCTHTYIHTYTHICLYISVYGITKRMHTTSAPLDYRLYTGIHTYIYTYIYTHMFIY
jgi:hypothetical protein